jgi:hypothetical protein
MKHVRNSAEQIHRFEDGDETIVVKVMKLTDGTYAAVEHENFDDRSPIGNGFSSLEAIADLFEKLPRAKSEREERDLMAAK